MHSQVPRTDGFGVNAGAIYGHVRMQLASLNQGTQIRVRSHGGFTFGAIYHKQLSQRVRVRPGIQFVALKSVLIYEHSDGDLVSRELFPAYLEIPLHFLFTNKEFGNNITALFGVKLSKSILWHADDELILRDSFTSADFGLGKEFTLGKTRLSPELILSLGVENIFRYSTIAAFNDNIESLYLNQLTLKVHWY